LKLYLDCEFTNFENPELISMALVPDSAGYPSFYQEFNDFEPDACTDFVLEEVMPLLTEPERLSSGLISTRLRAYLQALPAPVDVVADALLDKSLFFGLLGLQRQSASSVSASKKLGLGRFELLPLQMLEHPSYQDQLELFYLMNNKRKHYALSDAQAMRCAVEAFTNQHLNLAKKI
jgi:hypothetical protein